MSLHRQWPLAMGYCALLLALVAGCGEDPAPLFDDSLAGDGLADSGDGQIADTDAAGVPADASDADSAGVDGHPDAIAADADGTAIAGDGSSDIADQIGDTGIDPPDAPNVEVDAGPTCGPGTCGNGVLEPGETCDPASPPGVGACVAICDDGIACTKDTRLGHPDWCNATCVHQAITTCEDDDGCCGPGCTVSTDSDCVPTCGNGKVQADETCDNNCPTDCDDGNSCTDDKLVGDAAGCSAACSHLARVGCWDPDSGCCGGICSAGAEAKCPKATCGNGVVEPGELCDGDCPTSCGGSGCGAEVLVGDPNRCTAQCVAATPCQDGDGCCPQGCSFNDDMDCESLRCLCIDCFPPNSECAWNGVERTAFEGLLCGKAFGEPSCSAQSYLERCDYECTGGMCAPPPCLTPSGQPRIDFCGDALDDDCTDGARNCAPYPAEFETVHPVVTVGPGCQVAPAQIDLWALAGDHLGHLVPPSVRILNDTDAEIAWTNGVEGTSISATSSVIAPSGAAWSEPGTLSITIPGCPSADVVVGYFNAPEPPTVFDGVLLRAEDTVDEELLNVRVEVQAAPLALGTLTPQAQNPPATLRECTGYLTCSAVGRVRLQVDAGSTGPKPFPGLDLTLEPGSASQPFVSWNLVGPVLNLTFPNGQAVGSLKGPPNFLSGTLQIAVAPESSGGSGGSAPAEDLNYLLNGASWVLHVK